MIEKPTDPRFARSRAALIEAMTALLDERDFSAITITELVGRAKVTRPTFYQHFDGLPAAARTASVARLDGAFPIDVHLALRADAAREREVENRVLGLLEHLRGNVDFYRRVIKGASAVELYDDFVKLLETRITKSFQADAGARNLAGSTIEDRNAVLAGGLTLLIIRWLHTDFSNHNATPVMARRIATTVMAFA